LPFANLLQTIPPLHRVLSALDTIEEVVGDAVHNEVLDHLIVVFPLHGGLNAIYVAAIDVRLSCGTAGQVLLPAAHLQGDVKSIAICNPVGAIAGQPDYVDFHDVGHKGKRAWGACDNRKGVV